MSVYNGENNLNASIESILKQTFKDFEFIIIDDGSTDNSLQIISEYASFDKRIAIIQHENLGLTKSLNIGIKKAKGTYIARQDADDISEINRFELQAKYLDQHENVILVGCDYNVIGDDDKHLVTIFSSEIKSIEKKLRRTNPFCHGSIMFKRLIDGCPVHYNNYYVRSQDYDLICRMTDYGSIEILSEVLYNWRFSSTGIHVSKVNFYGETARNNYLNRLINRPELFPEPERNEILPTYSNTWLMWSLGIRYLSGYKRIDARKCFLKVLQNYNFCSKDYIKCITYIFATFLPKPFLKILRQ